MVDYLRVRPAEIQARTRSLGDLTEVYLTARPGPGAGFAGLFAGVAAVLGELDARIVQERIFAGSADLDGLLAERHTGVGPLDDGVAPGCLRSPAGRSSPLSGVLIHAVAGSNPSPIGDSGRLLRWREGALVTLSGLSSGGSPGAPFFSQAASVLARAGELLQRAGSSLRHLARTWLWVDRIEEHYADLNRARTGAFTAAGLIGADGVPRHLPASTGIGLRPARGALGLDAVAASGDALPRAWLAAGNQRSAFAYGSAFSRASRLRTPTGDTVYLSGTAAVNSSGKTVAPGDWKRQAGAMLDNVQAVLDELGLEARDIVQGVVYASTPAVAWGWAALAPDWPLLVVPADICRPDLAIEMEVTVCPTNDRGVDSPTG